MSDHQWHLYSNGDTEVPEEVTHLLIASNVTEIPRNLCGGGGTELLREIRFQPNSICHTIEVGAFFNCEGLVSVQLAPSVQCIQQIAFRNCEQLKVISVGSNDEDGLNQSLGTRVGTTTTTAATIASYPGYHSSCFFGASSLTEVYLAEGITLIGADSFSGCHSLVKIRFATTIEALRSAAFQGCTDLETVHLNHGLKLIEKAAFSGCENLRSIRIPGSVEVIGQSAFMRCKLLYSVEIELGSDLRVACPFRQCPNLSVVSMPAYTMFNSQNTFDRWCLTMARIFTNADPRPLQEKVTNRFANHGLHEFCYHACHEEDVVDVERLDDTIQQCRLDQQQGGVVTSQKLMNGINPLHILASSACPRQNVFHAVLDSLPFQLLFREDKIGLSPLVLLADNPSAEGQDLLLSLIPKLVSFWSSQTSANPNEKSGGAPPKKQESQEVD